MLKPARHRAPAPLRPRLATAALTATLCALAPRAHAQDTAAEAVFDEGLRLFERGDFAAACPKLRSAVDLSSGAALGGRLTLAECYEKLGKWASAWGMYREVAAKAAAAGQSARRDEAEAGRARVEPRLARLSIVLGPGVAALPELSISRDGERIPREAWDVALPVDPGTVTVAASATGKRAWSRTLSIADAPATSTVTIDRLEDAPAGALPAPTPAAGEPAAPPPSSPPAGPPPEDGGGLSGMGIAGLVLGGTGVVAIGVSALVAAGAKSSWDDAVSARDEAGVDDARGTGDAATGVFVAGAVLTAVGATLVVIDLANGQTSTSARRITVRTAGLGISTGGSF